MSEVIDEQDECGRYVHLKAPVAAGLSSGPQKRAEPSCLIYFKFKPRLNWKSWITLTPLVQDGLLRLKAAFSFLWLCLKKSYRNYFFWQTADPAAVDKRDKGRPAPRHYKAGFYQRATSPATSNSPSSAQWAWLNIWSTVSGLTRLAKLHLPVRKRYAFGQGDASPKMLRKVGVWCSPSPTCANLIQSRHLEFVTRIEICIAGQ